MNKPVFWSLSRKALLQKQDEKDCLGGCAQNAASLMTLLRIGANLVMHSLSQSVMPCWSSQRAGREREKERERERENKKKRERESLSLK